MIYLLPLVLLAAFAAGFCTFRVSRGWCRSCGSSLRCPACAAQPAQPAQPAGQR